MEYFAGFHEKNTIAKICSGIFGSFTLGKLNHPIKFRWWIYPQP
jgi:hypothetical protein